MKTFLKFIFAIVISFIPGIIGGFFSPMSPGANEWYNGLNQSVLTPNGWVFMWAWLILYALLGIALFLIMNNEKTRHSKTKAYVLFITQMVLNALWSFLFFGLHAMGWALLTIVALLAVAIWMAISFKPISRAASYLVWPYIAWLCFALYLNGTVILLN
ncbi:MAG: tryptophan-rich sensory protein [Alphaproteobacteria bacterium]|nr:tryptophan-rich sensory protein [Alphaproteobacteria bacterium]